MQLPATNSRAPAFKHGDTRGFDFRGRAGRRDVEANEEEDDEDSLVAAILDVKSFRTLGKRQQTFHGQKYMRQKSSTSTFCELQKRNPSTQFEAQKKFALWETKQMLEMKVREKGKPQIAARERWKTTSIAMYQETWWNLES